MYHSNYLIFLSLQVTSGHLSVILILIRIAHVLCFQTSSDEHNSKYEAKLEILMIMPIFVRIDVRESTKRGGKNKNSRNTFSSFSFGFSSFSSIDVRSNLSKVTHSSSLRLNSR